MKRKRELQPTTTLGSNKKLPMPLPKENVNWNCPLLNILSQYGILASITSYLFPKDLCSLALTSKAAHRAIFLRRESFPSLLPLMACDGRGVRIRNTCHRKSKFFYEFDCIEYAICGTYDTDRKVESRSCVECGITTCDECRIHCLYQSIYQPANEADELPHLSGFALLGEPEMGILSPCHLGIEDEDIWLLTGPQRKTYHDQGFLDIPLESSSYALPESVENIINADLGSSPLVLTPSSDIPYPSPIIQAFWGATEGRKRMFCDACYRENESKREHSGRVCDCSLRSRFLDRWLCLKCYQHEAKIIEEYARGVPVSSPSKYCSCGRPWKSSFTPIHTICLWCDGEVVHPSISSATSHSTTPVPT